MTAPPGQTSPSWCRRLISELRAADARAIALARPLTPSQLNWKPRPDSSLPLMGIPRDSSSGRTVGYRGAPWRRALAWTLWLILAGTGSALSARIQNPAPPAAVAGDLDTLLRDGQAAILAGNAKAALASFDAAVPLAERAGDDVLLGRSLNGLGWAQWATGRYDLSLVSRGRALEIFRRRDDVPRVTSLLRHLGETLYSMGRYDEALERYRVALESSRRTPQPVEEGLILSNIGSTYRSQGRYDEAADRLEQALTIIRPTGDRGALAQVLTFLGIVNRARGEYEQALMYYRDAIQARRDVADRRGEAQALGNMANVHLDLGEYETAADLSRRSLDMAQKIGYSAQAAFAQHNLGSALSRIPRPEEALRHYQLALESFRKIGRVAQIPWSLHSIGTLQAFLLGDAETGRTTLNEALATARTAENREAEGYILYELGSLDLRQGHLGSGMEKMDAALDIARTLKLPDMEYQVLANRGLASHRSGHTAAALADLRASAGIVNDLRANVASDQAKIAYIDTRQSVFNDLATVLSDAGHAGEALEAAEAGRARAFADLLSQRRVLGRPSDRAALQQVRAALSASSKPAAASAPDARRGDALDVAIRQLGSTSRELASLVTAESPRLAEIQETAVRLDATIIEYLVTERALLIWVVSPEGHVEHVQRPTRAADIERRVAPLRRILGAPTIQDLRSPHGADADLRGLYDLLIAPVGRWLPQKNRRLVIVPHGPTALVPFAALQDPRGVPMVERYVIAMTPSISTLRYTAAKRTARSSRPSALIVANPLPPSSSGLPRLPGTDEEGRRIARRLGRATLLRGAAATEGAVKKAAPASSVLHFATHGLISSIRPIASSLLLSADATEDGYLRLDEVFGMDLRADLVVLSGCSTGLGRQSGDGIFGLARGFIYAGTPTVVVSMWDVSDQATTLLMDEFYTALSRGRSKAEALAEAQRAARRRFRHPALWAAFVLIGEPR